MSRVKIFLTIIVLIFSFQSLTKADDLSEFEIEGMSVGDSLLDHFSKKEIKDKKKFINLGGDILKEYSNIIINKNLEKYNSLAISFKSDDSKFIVKGITGRNFYGQIISQCYDDMNKIEKEIKALIKKYDRNFIPKQKIKNMPNGDSYVTKVGFFVEDGVVGIQCYDFSLKDLNEEDRLSISIFSKEYNNWLLK